MLAAPSRAGDTQGAPVTARYTDHADVAPLSSDAADNSLTSPTASVSDDAATAPVAEHALAEVGSVVSSLNDESDAATAADEHKISAAWQLVPGLALLDGVIVDQHFAQRGRMGRLVAGVVENPRLLGLGIDENTGLVWTRNSCTVIGSGAVYIVDGRQVTQSNLRSARPQSAISAFDIRLHVLSAGDCFDMEARRPVT